MPEPNVFNANEHPWVVEERFPGIAFQILETSKTHPAMSVAIAKLDAGQMIKAHTHITETETAFILSGEAILMLGEREVPLVAKMGATIPPGLRHSIRNTGTEPLEILAMHTPPTR